MKYEYFIWDKEESLIGLSASTILNSRRDFIMDDVIVIHHKGERHNIAMIESATELKNTYNIQTDDPEAIGFMVSVIIEDEHPDTIKDKLDEIMNNFNSMSTEKQNNVVDDYFKMVENMIKALEGQPLPQEDKEPPHIPLKGDYEDPTCKIIDLSDIDEDVEEKTLKVVLDHVFVAEDDISNLRCLSEYKDKLKELEDLIDKYTLENEDDELKKVFYEYKKLKEGIDDLCDATIHLYANAIYQYNDAIIIDLANGQTMILENNTYVSVKSNEIAYQKRHINSEDKYKVHHRTVYITMNEWSNELIERNNSVFVISI